MHLIFTEQENNDVTFHVSCFVSIKAPEKLKIETVGWGREWTGREAGARSQGGQSEKEPMAYGTLNPPVGLRILYS